MIRSTNRELGEYDLIKRPEHVARVWGVIEATLPTYWQTFVEKERRENPVTQLAAKFGNPVAAKAEPEGRVLARVFEDAVTSYEKEAPNIGGFSNGRRLRSSRTIPTRSNRRSRGTYR